MANLTYIVELLKKGKFFLEKSIFFVVAVVNAVLTIELHLLLFFSVPINLCIISFRELPLCDTFIDLKCVFLFSILCLLPSAGYTPQSLFRQNRLYKHSNLICLWKIGL